MRFTHPFRFGVARIESAPQAFIHLRVATADGGRATGVSAEMMMPKWFDKNPAKSPADTVADLRASLLHAAGLYRSEGREARTPFGLHAEVYGAQMAWARERGLPALVGAYGPAVIDRAVLDAALRCAGLGLAAGLASNLPGLDGRLTPDLSDAGIAAFLGNLAPSRTVALRHTVGLADDLAVLDELVARHRLRFFKLKLGGEVEDDVRRLAAIGDCLGRRSPDCRATLDANEGYDTARLEALLAALCHEPALAELSRRLLYIEQPLARNATFDGPLPEAASRFAFIIDEADDGYDAFLRAAAHGYAGVSAKGCKGLYKSILNAVRAAEWNRRPDRARTHFIAAEDLTCQAGVAVQQDTALVACLGLDHAERNGHHYVDGFGPAPAAEAEAFLAAHPDFYAAFPGQGSKAAPLPTATLLEQPGFAGRIEPDWDAMARA